VANTPLNIDVNVTGQKKIDNLNKSLGRTTKSSINLGGALRLAGVAFAAIGIGKFAKSIVNTGRQVENLQMKFKFLFGSATEGAKAFDTLSEFAGTVPFSLEQIAAASGNLAVVSKDAEALRQNLELTANVAAISGLDFQTAGEQIQRALSGGISAADLLREKGIKSLLGFKDGVKVTVEETQEAFNRVFGKDGEFGNAAIAMANTFDGLVSMVGDKMFNLTKAISDSGPFDFLKAVIATTNDELEASFNKTSGAASKIGEGIVHGAKVAMIGAGALLDAMTPIFSFFQQSFNGIVKATNNLPNTIKLLGVVGFLFLGTKGKALVLAIGYVVDYALMAYASLGKALAKAKEIAATAADAIGLDGTAERLRQEANSIRSEMDEITKGLNKTGDAFNDASVDQLNFLEKIESGEIVLDKFGQKMFDIVKQIEAKNQALKDSQKEQEKLLKKVEEQTGAFGNLEFSVFDLREAFIKTMTEMVEKFKPAQEAVNLLINGFQTFKKGVGDAFADAIMGAKSFGESIKALATTILHQLISGIVQLGVQLIVFKLFKKFTDEETNSMKKLNSQLQKQIGLRLVLNALTGGMGSFLPGFASGGSVGASAPIVVGERGPEIFVPNSSGTIIPNNELGMSPDTGTGSTTENMNVTFNINTIDAADFNELLETRQDLIIGLINRGLAERGKRSLTA